MRELEVAFSALVVLVHLLLVGGLQCPLPDEATEDHVSICAMCSDSSAAVRLRVRENEVFETLLLRYECNDENGTVVYEGNSVTLDPCFNPYPELGNHGLITGTTGVGYQLWVGLQCEFRVGYRTDRGRSTTKSSYCTVKSPETCAESPDECVIDRVSSLNEEGECEFYCTPGYSGQLCNNINECTGINMCHANSECFDTDGSYMCECWPGYEGDGYKCTDFNECESANVTCGENATCVNTEGNYSCECDTGFTGDGYNCTDITECLNMMCGENATCVNTEGNYSCQCDPGFTGDGYNCTDVDECEEGSFTCPEGTFCSNLEGNYHCAPNISGSIRSPAVVVAIVVCASILLLAVVLIMVPLMMYCFGLRKQKMPAFHELTKTDLDPYYMPRFWEGSLLSVQSMYEKLIFTESTNDLSGSEGKEHSEGTSCRVTPMISEPENSSIRQAKLNPQTQADDHGTPAIAGKSDYVSHSSFIAQQPQQQSALNSIAGFDSRTISPADSRSSAENDTSSPGTSISCVNFTFEVPLPDTELPTAEATQAVAGYVQENSISGSGGASGCNQHQVTSFDSAKLQDITPVEVREQLEQAVKGGGYEGSSSGYNTESTAEVLSEVEYQENHEVCGAESLNQDCQGEHATGYVPSSVGGSSGYVTDSTINEELASPSTSAPNLPIPATWHSEASLESSDSDDDAASTELVESDIDSVKFTVNARQEFEYVNTVEEKFMKDVKFDID